MGETTTVGGMEGEDTYRWQAMSITNARLKQPCKRNNNNYITAECVLNDVGFYAELKVDDSECVKKESEIDLTELAKVQ